MAKFNKSLEIRKTSIVQSLHNMINRGGGIAFRDKPLMALYRQVATSLWSGDGYYERHDEWFERFQRNVRAAVKEDARFPFALAAYARDKRGLALRTSPIALYVEAAINRATKGSGYIRKYAPKILLRADEPAEAIAYFKRHYKGVIPHGILRGITDTLGNFDEYQLGKYKGTGSVSMRDVFRLARPKPTNEDEEALWHKVVSRTLEIPYTWEVEISKCTSLNEKHQKWNELIYSGKLGIFALARNIRNIVECGADIEEALSQITQDRIKGSGILPFQWYKAYKAIASSAGSGIASQMLQALEWSIDEVPKIPGITLVACDNSGSMLHRAARDMSYAEIGNLMGAMALYCCENGIAGTFGSSFALANTDSSKSILDNKWYIDECGKRTGHSTDAWRIFEFLIRNRVYVDRVILLSDMQCYDSGARFTQRVIASHSLSAELNSYRQINPGVVVYSVNLATQDNSCQFAPDQPVVELAGWSESIFHFISAMEVGDNMVQMIKDRY